MTQNYEVRTNQWGATDIHFNERPSKQVIDLLKSNGFRWFGKTESWSSFKVKPEDVEKLLNGEQVEITTNNVKKEVIREHGLKVGDILELMFGYDETHYSFFIITELIGKKSVRIKEVYPKVVESRANGDMAEYNKYSTTEYEIIPSSIWIDDNEKGAVKQVSDFYKDENGKAIAVKGWHHHTLTLYKGGERYESWYA